MNIHFIKSSEKKHITENLNQNFGIGKIPYLLIRSGKERIRAFSGHLSKEEILQINRLTNLEAVGIYFMKEENEKEIRLTLDAIHLLQDQITKNTLEISQENTLEWLRGKDLSIKTPYGPVVLTHNFYLLGFGKSTGEKILNFIPKERRLKK